MTDSLIKDTRFILTLVAIVATSGILALRSLPRSEDPPFVFRYALIETLFLGASAEQIEALVTSKIESALQSIPELESFRSQSRNHASIVIIKAHDSYRELSPIWTKVRRVLDEMAPNLPNGAQEPIFHDDLGKVYGVIITVAAKQMAFSELRSAANSLGDELLALEDVSGVELLGNRKDRVLVEYDDEKMAETGFSPLQLKLFLESQNVMASQGTVREGTQRLVVETAGYYRSLNDIDRLTVPLPRAEDNYTLGQLADVRDDYFDPPFSYLAASGSPALGLAVSLREGANIEVMGRQVKNTVDRFRKRAPEAVELNYLAFEPDRVSKKMETIFMNLLKSLTIVMVILVIALGPRTGLMIASLVPLVILAALAVLSLGCFNTTLNQVVLAGFVVVLGILVDNHIVITERILALIEDGAEPRAAAESAVKELYGPLLTAAFCTIAGFLPIFLARSTAGEYASPLFLVVTISILCSQAFGFTVTPALAAWLIPAGASGSGRSRFRKTRRIYLRLLEVLLRHPLPAFFAVLVFLGLSIFSFHFIEERVFPPLDRPVIALELEFPRATAIERTRQAADETDRFIKHNLKATENEARGIVSWATFVGRNAPRFVLNHRPRIHEPELAYFLINITSAASIPFLRDRLTQFCRTQFPEAQVRMGPLETGPGIGYPIQVRIKGDRIERLFAIVAEVKEKFRGIPGLRNIGDDWGERVKNYRVVVDDEAALTNEITHIDIAISIQSVLTGIPAGRVATPEGDVPIMIQARLSGDTLETLRRVHVYSNLNGGSLPLGQIAHFVEQAELTNIIRVNQQRAVAVHADVHPNQNPKQVDDLLRPWIEQRQEAWGTEYPVSLAGEGTESANANRSIVVGIPWMMFIITILILRQMRSYRRTFIVFSIVPSGIIGGILGLLFTGQPFGFISLVGLVALTGIVVSNAIILVDRVRLNQEAGQSSDYRSLVEAAANRLRPIVLTTLTTIGGILPLALGTATWRPMAVTLIFGLLFSTFLVLGFLPVLYALVFGIRFETGDDPDSPGAQQDRNFQPESRS